MPLLPTLPAPHPLLGIPDGPPGESLPSSSSSKFQDLLDTCGTTAPWSLFEPHEPSASPLDPFSTAVGAPQFDALTTPLPAEDATCAGPPPPQVLAVSLTATSSGAPQLELPPIALVGFEPQPEEPPEVLFSVDAHPFPLVPPRPASLFAPQVSPPPIPLGLGLRSPQPPELLASIGESRVGPEPQTFEEVDGSPHPPFPPTLD